MKIKFIWFILAASFFLIQCTSKNNDTNKISSGENDKAPTEGSAGSMPGEPGASATKLNKTNGSVERGKAIYLTNCIACHNANPKLDGGVGPAVFGAKENLLKAKIIDGSYPEGYKPKRTSKLMQVMPQLKDDIINLEAFLNFE